MKAKKEIFIEKIQINTKKVKSCKNVYKGGFISKVFLRKVLYVSQREKGFSYT